MQREGAREIPRNELGLNFLQFMSLQLTAEPTQPVRVFC